MKQLSSAITGAVSQVQKATNSIGLRRGETGSATLPAVSESKQREWLLAHTPEETDRLLRASLTSSLNVGLREEAEWRFPNNKPAYKLVHSVSAVGESENFGAAFAKVSGAMTPATRDQVEEWLAMLQAATAGGRKSEVNSALALAVYVNALKDFPADVVKAVCERAMVREEWFPPLSRLIAECKDLAADRRIMLETFSRYAR